MSMGLLLKSKGSTINDLGAGGKIENEFIFSVSMAFEIYFLSPNLNTVSCKSPRKWGSSKIRLKTLVFQLLTCDHGMATSIFIANRSVQLTQYFYRDIFQQILGFVGGCSYKKVVRSAHH